MDVDDILCLILERIDSHVSLIRAASTCKRWRRIIADPVFLRRYRSLHAPAVAGDYFLCYSPGVATTGEPGRWYPLFVPSSPSIDAGLYSSLDFLADAGLKTCVIVDSRGSLLLIQSGEAFSSVVLTVVCEPLTRRYRKIPPPPLAFNNGGRRCQLREPFLVGGDSDDEAGGGRISLSNFRVVSELFGDDGLMHLAVFTASGADDDSAWSDKVIDHVSPSPRMMLGRTAGSWYFYKGDRALVRLDCYTGEFSSSVLPPLTEDDDWDDLDSHIWNNDFGVTEGRDGKLRIFTALGATMKVFVANHNGGGWALEKKVLLSEVARGLPGYQPSFFNQPLDILTRGLGFVILKTTSESWTFSVDLETLEISMFSIYVRI
ncbi:hypothetical protein BAE44_0022013 [Dichanthelium oligosanthes]|uniref:F-box domain-containing protein n=1 Tax=Dichanthelium oligosanthes TaxID=888268 RepID=A0A1E5UVQ0_9POAL|nr:hypothetical protein BAE44_0022013 [Dichanthelium oligosanthes]